MESNDGFSQLLELIFSSKVTISDKKVSHCSIPPRFLKEDFSKKLGVVLHVKKIISFSHFRKCFGKYGLKLLSPYENAPCKCYVMGIIIACLCEYETNRKIFEKFISVCAVAMSMSERTLSMTGLDFRDLNPDIIMVFYQNDVIQSPFHKERDFQKFFEFIRDHRFLKWNWDKIDHASPEGASSVSLELNQKIREEVNRYPPLPEEVKSAMEDTAISMAEVVLSKMSVELATLPSKADLIEKLTPSRKMDIEKQTKRKGQAKTALTNATSHENSSSISDSKPNCSAAQQEDIEWYESIVQAVTRHNHSNISHHEDAQNPKLVEAEETLEYLKTSIKSLMEVLDESNQE